MIPCRPFSFPSDLCYLLSTSAKQHSLKSLPIAQYSALYLIAQPLGLNPLPRVLRTGGKSLLIALLADLIWASACRN